MQNKRKTVGNPSCNICRNLPKSEVKSGTYDYKNEILGHLNIGETIFNGHYRDRFGDNCQKYETIRNCPECSWDYYIVIETESEVCNIVHSLSAKHVTKPEIVKIQETKGHSRNEPFDP